MKTTICEMKKNVMDGIKGGLDMQNKNQGT